MVDGQVEPRPTPDELIEPMHQGEVGMHTCSLVTKMWNFTDSRPAGRNGLTATRNYTSSLHSLATWPSMFSARIAFKNSPGGFAEAVCFSTVCVAIARVMGPAGLSVYPIR
jgi:hypothetical protein